MNDFIGKYVKVYPSDSNSYSKFGTIVFINDNGIVVQIDGKHSNDPTWKEFDEKLMFLAFSAHLTFVKAE